MSLTLIDNIYKKWKDIKEYADSRIQFATLSIKNNIETLIQPAIDSLQRALDKKQDKLKAGENITISGNTISAKGGETYRAGQNIDISNNSISAKGYVFDDTKKSFAEGEDTTASGYASHTEGVGTKASGYTSHAEGYNSQALEYYSHAEGASTIASNYYAHAEGYSTTASGNSSHAEGFHTITSGNYSHTEGDHTIAQNTSEHAQGKYNKSNSYTDNDKTINTIHSTGIGTSNNDRKNAVEVMDNGDVYVIGIGGYDGTNPESAQTLQQVIASLVPSA